MIDDFGRSQRRELEITLTRVFNLRLNTKSLTNRES